MKLLAIVVVLTIGLLLVARFVGPRQERALGQYELLKKRFGFKLRTRKSRWGKGINERFALEGDFHGYPISIHSHFHKEGGRKVEWTSLVLELLSAGELAFDVVFEGSAPRSRFETLQDGESLPLAFGASFQVNRPNAEKLLGDKSKARLEAFSKKIDCGVFRLSKGFLEYREPGLMTSDEMRIRYQDALLLSAELADAVSVFVAKESAS